MLHLTAARRALQEDGDSAEAIEALIDAERLGRHAMGDIRRTVDLLRTGPTDQAPEPGIADIEFLVADFVRAGLPVDYVVRGTTAPVSPTVGLCLYRIAQESLAKVAKHADGARTRVTLDIGTSASTLTIVNELSATWTRATAPRRIGSGGYGVPSAIAQHNPDVVVMDLRMKHVGGIAATEQIRRGPHPVAVLVLTTFDDDDLLSGGAARGRGRIRSPGFFGGRTHPCRAQGRRRRAWLDPAVTSRVLSTYRTAPVAGNGATPAVAELTARERDVLALIGRGQSNAEIADALTISEVTVKSHVGRIFGKLGLRDRAAAIVYAFDHGIVTPRR